jgi:heat shock protein HtpX
MGKRVLLFIATNLAIMLMLSIVMKVLGLEPYLTAQGLNYTSLMVFCGLWGMGGAFISLILSKKMATWSMGVKIIDPHTNDSAGRELVQTVHRMARSAGLEKMPEVGYYESGEVNAFATGPSRNNSLVAVSSGLLQRMDRGSVEGVLGHEVAHIANGDMVTMTLVQGVVNAFVMFFARIAAFAVSNFLRDEDGRGGVGMLAQWGIIIAFELIFGLLGSIVVMAFSRHREFRADAGGAKYAGRGKMIQALQALRANTDLVDTRQKELATLKIAGPKGFAQLFLSHPPLEERIERLKSYTA